MKCKNVKCKNEHDSSFGSGIFCSRSCANSRIQTRKTNRKRSLSLKDKRWGVLREKPLCLECKKNKRKRLHQKFCSVKL